MTDPLEATGEIDRFAHLFGQDPELIVEAPGRVNLIGGSTDYNQGYVLPVAIDRGILLLSHRTHDNRIRAHSIRRSSWGEMETTGDQNARGWLRYLSGILVELRKEGHKVGGLDLMIDGDLPMEAGLGSSAALEIGFAVTLDHLFGLGIPMEVVIRTCHRVENEFVGMNCGIMDQFITARGRAGRAVLLDCRDMSYEYLDLPEEFLSLLLFDSGVRRELVRSDYNVRRSECLASLEEIRTKRPAVTALRDLSPGDLPWLASILEPVPYRRCRHVVTEIDRVLLAAEALRRGDPKGLGELICASHASLRDDFEVSCGELDHLFDAAVERDGVFGARLTGAGFGGNVLVVCRPSSADDVKEGISRSFRARYGRPARALRCGTANGVSTSWIEPRSAQKN